MRRCDTLFYDAQCALCRAWKEWVEQGTSQRPLTFVDANDRQYAQALGIVDVQRLDRQMCLLTAEGTTLWGYDALVGLIQRQPAAGGVAWIMALAPVRTLGHWLYSQVASRRRCAPH